MGNTIPKVVVTDPKSNEIWDSIGYKAINEKRLKETKGNIKEHLEGWSESDPPTIPKSNIKWLTPSGTHYQGKFVGVKNGALMIVQPNKKKPMKLNFSKLSPATVSYAKKLAAIAREEAIAAKMPTLADEAWVSTDGRPLNATFVSLEEGKITLKGAGNQVFTFDLDRLNDESKARAKKIAKQIADAQAL